jgi:hypothetical protein
VSTVENLPAQHLDMLIGRWDGPLAFRIMIQPAVAAFLAIRTGLRDARAGRPAYGWTITTDPVQRRDLIREGWKDVWKLFTAAVIMDLIYELIVFRRIYPGQALIVAAILALPSYFFIRGLANRIARHWLPAPLTPTPGNAARKDHIDGGPF